MEKEMTAEERHLAEIKRVRKLIISEPLAERIPGV